jgi:hypothetical protein
MSGVPTIPAPQRVLVRPSWIKVGEKPRPNQVINIGFLAFVVAVAAASFQYLSGDRGLGLLLFGVGCLLFLMVMWYRSTQGM